MKKFILCLLFYFSILPLLCGSVFGAGHLLGDLNGDGKADLFDEIQALKIISGTDTAAQTININNADINFDGKLSVEKMISVLQAVAGLRERHAIGTIGPDGGTFQSADGRVKLVFPANTVPVQTYIFITPNYNFPADNGVIPGSVYSLGPIGLEFDQPVTITIQYDPNVLPTSLTEANLRLSRTLSDFWAPLTGSTVDLSMHTVTSTITSFSGSYAARAPIGPQLSPAAAIVQPEEEIEISISNITADLYNPKWCRYEVAGTYGLIHTGLSLSPSTVSEGFTGPVHYLAKSRAGTDTLTVEVFDGPNASYPSLGKAKALIYVGEHTVSVFPTQAQLQGSQQVNLTAVVMPKIDDTMSLTYQWSNTAAAGDLTDGSPGNLNAFQSAGPAAVYTGKDYGNTTDTITVAVKQKGGGLGSPQEYEAARDTAEVTVRPGPCPDSIIPDSSTWRYSCADLTIGAQRIAPGGTIQVTTIWSGDGCVCETSATLWCAGATDAGTFESGLFDINSFCRNPSF
ncbi:MAG: hypothetical protein ABIJ31_00015 [Pseudomonadota bacterium]